MQYLSLSIFTTKDVKRIRPSQKRETSHIVKISFCTINMLHNLRDRLRLTHQHAQRTLPTSYSGGTIYAVYGERERKLVFYAQSFITVISGRHTGE